MLHPTHHRSLFESLQFSKDPRNFLAEVLGSSWKSLEVFGSPRKCLGVLGSLWKFQEALGSPWKSLEVLGIPWKSFGVSRSFPSFNPHDKVIEIGFVDILSFQAACHLLTKSILLGSFQVSWEKSSLYFTRTNS